MLRPAPLLAVSLLLAACGGNSSQAGSPGPRIYVALDEQFSRPLLDRFARELGVAIDQKHDTEGNKTVGFVSLIREEAKAPRCTVFWNNELAHTVRLSQLGLLEPYASPAGADLPAAWRDPEHRWHGFAARARVLIVNKRLLPDPKDWPTSYRDLLDPKWKGRCAVAIPLTGTTMTHFTALWLQLGDAEFLSFLDGIDSNEVQKLKSNGATMRAVVDGTVAWAFTDTDDYHVALQRGHPVGCVFPDQQQGGIGTMLIPNSIALIKGGPDPENGRKLIDRILSRETEALLAAADGAQIPLRDGVPGPEDPAILAYGKFRAMQWDVSRTAENIARFGQTFGKRFGQ